MACVRKPYFMYKTQVVVHQTHEQQDISYLFLVDQNVTLHITASNSTTGLICESLVLQSTLFVSIRMIIDCLYIYGRTKYKVMHSLFYMKIELQSGPTEYKKFI